jgi:hypothetical protein
MPFLIVPAMKTSNLTFILVCINSESHCNNSQVPASISSYYATTVEMTRNFSRISAQQSTTYQGWEDASINSLLTYHHCKFWAVVRGDVLEAVHKLRHLIVCQHLQLSITHAIPVNHNSVRKPVVYLQTVPHIICMPVSAYVGSEVLAVLSSATYCHLVCSKETVLSEEHTASIFRVKEYAKWETMVIPGSKQSRLWEWRHYVPLKCQLTFNRPHTVILQ